VREAVRLIAKDIDKYWGRASICRPRTHHQRWDPFAAHGNPHILEVLAQETRRFLPLFPDDSKLISDADLLVDFRVSNGSCPNLQSLGAALPQLSKWRSFIVLAGAFPKDLQGLERNRLHTLPRDEWFYWREQVLMLPRSIRRPTFGDYTIQHAVYQEPPENSNPSASIRYTHSDYWIIMRGEGVKNKDGPGYAQYPAEAQLLCERDEFCGGEFSRGDRYMYKTSQTPDPPGNARTWLRAGINHHMVYAVRQIAAFFGTPAKHVADERSAGHA
jgi:hypothetical protein